MLKQANITDRTQMDFPPEIRTGHELNAEEERGDMGKQWKIRGLNAASPFDHFELYDIAGQ